MNSSYKRVLVTIIIAVSAWFFYSCEPDSPDISPMPPSTSDIPKADEPEKILYFLENSGSMKGYVNGDTDFEVTISGLAHLAEFDKVDKSFYFISGKAGACIVEPINNFDSQGFIPTKYSQKFSDLTEMFEVALDSAHSSNISIVVTDGLYDIGVTDDPIRALEKVTKKTQETFRSSLTEEGIETILIKATSKFTGTYYMASGGSTSTIKHSRPYYIFLFGKKEYFGDEVLKNIRQEVKGFENLTRFITVDQNLHIPYAATNDNRRGSYKIDYNDKRKINDAESYHGVFQFSIEADLSTIPVSREYKLDTENYTASNNYRILSVVEKDNRLADDLSDPTHLITVVTDKNPIGETVVELVFTLPDWIEQTDAIDESAATVASNKTFGFRALTDAISEAYSFYNANEPLARFKVKISN